MVSIMTMAVAAANSYLVTGLVPTEGQRGWLLLVVGEPVEGPVDRAVVPAKLVSEVPVDLGGRADVGLGFLEQEGEDRRY